MKMLLEDVIGKANTTPYGMEEAAYCQLLNKHIKDTYFPLLKALKRLDDEYKDARAICGMLELTTARDEALKAIETASYIEVSHV